MAPDGQDCIRRPGVDALQGLDHGGQGPRPEHRSRQVRPQDRRPGQGVRSRRRRHDRLGHGRRGEPHGERGGRRRNEARRLPDLDQVHGRRERRLEGRHVDRRVRGTRRRRRLHDHERAQGASRSRSRSRPCSSASSSTMGSRTSRTGATTTRTAYAVTIPVGDRNKFSPGTAGPRPADGLRAGPPGRCVPDALRRFGRQPRLDAVRARPRPPVEARRPATRRSSSARSRCRRTTRACSSCGSTTRSSRRAATGRRAGSSGRASARAA